MKSWAEWGFHYGNFISYNNTNETHTCSTTQKWWDAVLVATEAWVEPPIWGPPYNRPRYRNATNDGYNQSDICGPTVPEYKWIFYAGGNFLHWETGGVRAAVAILQDYVDRSGTYASEAEAAITIFDNVLDLWHREWKAGAINPPYLFHKAQDTSFPTNYIPSITGQTMNLVKVSGAGTVKAVSLVADGYVSMRLEKVTGSGSVKEIAFARSSTAQAMDLEKVTGLGSAKALTMNGGELVDNYLELGALWKVQEELEGRWS